MGKLIKGLGMVLLVTVWAFLMGRSLAGASETEQIYLNNGTVIGCDKVWRGLGNTIWCQDSFNVTGYAANEVDLKRTLEIAPMIRSFLKESQEVFFGSTDLDKIIEKTDEGLKLDPGNEYLYSIRAGAFARKGSTEEAIVNCLKVLDLNWNNPYAHFYIGYISEAEGELDRARNKYEESCELGLDDACARYKKITGYYPDEIPQAIKNMLDESKTAFRKKQWERVVELTSKVLELDPERAVAYTNRAGAFFYMGLYEEAIADCDKAIRINPDFGLAYNNRGAALEGMGNPDEALQEYASGCKLGNLLACQNYDRLKVSAK